MIFISLDVNNRICGLRMGSYTIDEKHEHEIVIEDVNFNFEENFYALYDLVDNKIIYDELYHQGKERQHTKSKVIVTENDIIGFINIELDKLSISLGYKNINSASIQNKTLSNWRDLVWSWFDNYDINYELTYEQITQNILENMPKYSAE